MMECLEQLEQVGTWVPLAWSEAQGTHFGESHNKKSSIKGGLVGAKVHSSRLIIQTSWWLIFCKASEKGLRNLRFLSIGFNWHENELNMG